MGITRWKPPFVLRKDIIYHAENKDTFYGTNDNLTDGE